MGVSEDAAPKAAPPNAVRAPRKSSGDMKRFDKYMRTFILA